MTRIVVKELIWDDWNLEHIQIHQVSKEEAEASGQLIIYHKRTRQDRYLAIGRCNNRLITLILIWIGPTKYYLVTARDSSQKERKRAYEKEKKSDS